MPKLAVAVAVASRQPPAASRRILAARTAIGNGSDAPDSPCATSKGDPRRFRSLCRAPGRAVAADAGYDAGANHHLARIDLGVASVIPPLIGRPSADPPAGPFRRLMRERFAARADAAAHGQRARSGTVRSMTKRNPGECLRSALNRRRRREMMLRSVVHNLTLGSAGYEGRD